MSEKASPGQRIDYSKIRAERYIQSMVAQIQSASFTVAANGIIIGITVTVLSPQTNFWENEHKTLLKIGAILFSLFSMVLASLATLWRTSKDELPKHDGVPTVEVIISAIDAYADNANALIRKRQFLLACATMFLAVSVIWVSFAAVGAF